ncbi:MAG TPA: hypothetical protein VE521_04935 [Nitrososphaera sp.]|jgi:hypothetical protein|nr:hypothetical protein [Nitrososphaera sp.]
MAVLETIRFKQSLSRRALYRETAETTGYTLKASTALWLATMEMTTCSLMAEPVVFKEVKEMMFLEATRGHNFYNGGPGADTFNCSPDSGDEVEDYNPAEGDVVSADCETIN